MADTEDDVPVEVARPVEPSEPELKPPTEEHEPEEVATDGPGEASDDSAEAELGAGPDDGAETEAAEDAAAAVEAPVLGEQSHLPETGAPAPDEPVGDVPTAEAPVAEPDTEEESPARVEDGDEAEVKDVEVKDFVTLDEEGGGEAVDARDPEVFGAGQMEEHGEEEAAVAGASAEEYEREDESEHAGWNEAQVRVRLTSCGGGRWGLV
jgi:hypothetical protein